MSIKKGRFYLTFKSSLIAFFLIKFFVNYSQPFCNLTATLHFAISCIGLNLIREKQIRVANTLLPI